MIFYPPTTLLPPSLPYRDIDALMTATCDKCFAIVSDERTPPAEIEQYFEYTMALIDFWFFELTGEGFSAV